MEKDIEKARKTLLQYYSDLSDKRLKLMDKHDEWRQSIQDRSISFSQFLFTVGAAIMAIFFGVEGFKKLIVNYEVFNWSITIFILSFILFIFYSREKIDLEGKNINESYEKSENDFEEGVRIFHKQLNDGINLSSFYDDLTDLSNKNKKDIEDAENASKKEYADYSLELFTFLLMTSFWLLFISTRNWNNSILYFGLGVIFCITNNQNKIFYKLTKTYSRVVGKIFPFN